MAGTDPTADPTGTARAVIASDADRLRVLIDAVTEYAIYLLAPDGTVMTWNPGAERLKGYAHGEIVGEHFSLFYTAEDVDDRRPQRNLETARRDGVCVDDGWRVRKDGSRFWAHIVMTPLMDGDEVRGFAKVTRDDSAPRAAAARADALHTINTMLLDGASLDSILTVIARSARDLIGASAAWIAIRHDDDYVVRAADGPVAPATGEHLPDVGALGSRDTGEASFAVDDIGTLLARQGLAGLGPAVVVPLRMGTELSGALTVAGLSGAVPFKAEQRRFLEVLAAQTAVVLEHESARRPGSTS